MLLGAERENDMTINSLSHGISALYMQGGSNSAGSSQFTSGASSSNSSDVESSTGGRITAVSLVPYGSQPLGFTQFFPQRSQPQSQQEKPPYFLAPNNFGYGTSFVGNMDPSFSNGQQMPPSTLYNGNQHRSYNGNQ